MICAIYYLLSLGEDDSNLVDPGKKVLLDETRDHFLKTEDGDFYFITES